MNRTKGATLRGAVGLTGEERRRSQRVLIQVPVTVTYTISGEVITVCAQTVSVNDHGAMLLSPRNIAAETKLEIVNHSTRHRQSGRVTRTPSDTQGGFLVPVEFDAPAPSFWGISFPTHPGIKLDG